MGIGNGRKTKACGFDDQPVWARSEALPGVVDGLFLLAWTSGIMAFVAEMDVLLCFCGLWLIGERFLGRLPLGVESLILQRATRIAQADAMNGHRRKKFRASTTFVLLRIQGRTLLREKVCKRACEVLKIVSSASSTCGEFGSFSLARRIMHANMRAKLTREGRRFLGRGRRARTGRKGGNGGRDGLVVFEVGSSLVFKMW